MDISPQPQPFVKGAQNIQAPQSGPAIQLIDAIYPLEELLINPFSYALYLQNAGDFSSPNRPLKVRGWIASKYNHMVDPSTNDGVTEWEKKLWGNPFTQGTRSIETDTPGVDGIMPAFLVGFTFRSADLFDFSSPVSIANPGRPKPLNIKFSMGSPSIQQYEVLDVPHSDLVPVVAKAAVEKLPTSLHLYVLSDPDASGVPLAFEYTRNKMFFLPRFRDDDASDPNARATKMKDIIQKQQMTMLPSDIREALFPPPKQRITTPRPSSQPRQGRRATGGGLSIETGNAPTRSARSLRPPQRTSLGLGAADGSHESHGLSPGYGAVQPSRQYSQLSPAFTSSSISSATVQQSPGHNYAAEWLAEQLLVSADSTDAKVRCLTAAIRVIKTSCVHLSIEC